MLASALLAPCSYVLLPPAISVLFHDGFEVPSIGTDGGDIETIHSQDPRGRRSLAAARSNSFIDPNDALYYGTNGETPNPIPNMDGVQIAFVFNTGGESAETFSHTLTDDLILGDTYTLGISVGFRKNTAVGTLGYSLELLANGVVLRNPFRATAPDLTPATPSSGSAFSYTPVATDPIGQPLEIRFGTTQSTNLAATSSTMSNSAPKHPSRPAAACSPPPPARCWLAAAGGPAAGVQRRKTHIVARP